MRRLILLTLAAVFATALAGCESTAPNTNNARNNVNNNTNANNIAVVNNNGNANTGAMNSNANSNRWNANISQEEYDKDKTGYSSGKRATETIGSGAKDGWLWFKTRSALAVADDLRDSTIDVDVENGVITLKGTVATAAQKSAAVKVANGIEGKTGAVKDMIKVAANDSATNLSTTDSDTKSKSNSNMNKK